MTVRNTFEFGIINLTTRCTLKCRHCFLLCPQLPKMDFDFDKLKKELEIFFRVIDFVDCLTLSGGETFLYPHLIEVLTELEKYSSSFNSVRILTNGTLLPDDELIRKLQQLEYKYYVRVSDYGEVSTKLEELLDLLENNGIVYDVVRYTDEEQYGGGWIDLGVDICNKNYTEKQLEEVYANCREGVVGHDIELFDGKLIKCSLGRATWLGVFEPAEGDEIDLHSSLTIEEMRVAVYEMERRAIEACKYCYGFDIDRSPRVRAAIQIED